MKLKNFKMVIKVHESINSNEKDTRSHRKSLINQQLKILEKNFID